MNLVTPGKCESHGVDNVGTVPAAVAVYAAVSAFKPDLVVNAGTAGGFKVGFEEVVANETLRCRSVLTEMYKFRLCSVVMRFLTLSHQLRLIAPLLLFLFQARGAAIGDVFIGSHCLHHDRRIPIPVS